jgi:hypothetical protein
MKNGEFKSQPGLEEPFMDLNVTHMQIPFISLLIICGVMLPITNKKGEENVKEKKLNSKKFKR